MISLVLSNGENTEENKYSPEKKKDDVFTGWCIHLYNYDAEFIPMNSLTYLRTSIHISTSLKYIKDVLTSLRTHLTLSPLSLSSLFLTLTDRGRKSSSGLLILIDLIDGDFPGLYSSPTGSIPDFQTQSFSSPDLWIHTLSPSPPPSPSFSLNPTRPHHLISPSSSSSSSYSSSSTAFPLAIASPHLLSRSPLLISSLPLLISSSPPYPPRRPQQQHAH